MSNNSIDIEFNMHGTNFQLSGMNLKSANRLHFKKWPIVLCFCVSKQLEIRFLIRQAPKKATLDFVPRKVDPIHFVRNTVEVEFRFKFQWLPKCGFSVESRLKMHFYQRQQTLTVVKWNRFAYRFSPRSIYLIFSCLSQTNKRKIWSDHLKRCGAMINSILMMCSMNRKCHPFGLV